MKICLKCGKKTHGRFPSKLYNVWNGKGLDKYCRECYIKIFRRKGTLLR